MFDECQKDTNGKKTSLKILFKTMSFQNHVQKPQKYNIIYESDTLDSFIRLRDNGRNKN